MNKFCYSCAAPLEIPEFKGPAENYCRNCTDAEGNLKSKTEVQIGLAWWLRSWQPDLSEEESLARAEHYMKAMPAWAE